VAGICSIFWSLRRAWWTRQQAVVWECRRVQLAHCYGVSPELTLDDSMISSSCRPFESSEWRELSVPSGSSDAVPAWCSSWTPSLLLSAFFLLRGVWLEGQLCILLWETLLFCARGRFSCPSTVRILQACCKSVLGLPSIWVDHN
jgi:hypothetical protein